MLKHFRKNEKEDFNSCLFLTKDNKSQKNKSHSQFKQCEKTWIASFFSQTCLLIPKSVFSTILCKKH